jgi:catechol 2,3-dioxygenase
MIVLDEPLERILLGFLSRIVSIGFVTTPVVETLLTMVHRIARLPYEVLRAGNPIPLQNKVKVHVDHFRLPDQTHIATVDLRVHNLNDSLKFYGELLGLNEIRCDDSTVRLSAASSTLFVLTEKPDAQERSQRAAGLFHTAILYPDRKELAKIFRRLYDHMYPFQGFADHGVSEALYLADPEGNGIELYADRPRSEWRLKNGSIEMFTEPLDLDNLLTEIRGEPDTWNGAHPETRIGHIHLQVSDLGKAETFYHEMLGFDVTQRSYPGALFVSAGSYHHHIGMNIWNSRGASPASPDSLGLIRYSIEIPDRQTLEQLKERFDGLRYPYETFSKGGGLLLKDPDNIEVEIHTKH